MNRTRVVRLGVACCLAASPAPAQRLGPRDVDTLRSRQPDLREAYGTDSLQFGELRLPRSGTGSFPVAVVIHGGCWTKGFATLRNTAAVASALADDGIATWNVEYRQMGDPGGGWPNSFLDVGASVDHLRALAKPWPLDLSRVVVLGHSAGAHLALWAAGRPRLAPGSVVRGRDPLPVRAAVAIDGPGDLASLIGQDAHICGKPVIAPFMGGTREAEPDRYRQGSPIEMLPIGVRQYLVSATVLTVADAQAYESAARAAGDSARVLVAAAGGHFGVIAPDTPFWPPVRDFIRAAFGLAPAGPSKVPLNALDFEVAGIPDNFPNLDVAIDTARIRGILGAPRRATQRDDLTEWTFDGLVVLFGPIARQGITLTTPRYATRRGLRVGDTEERLISLYGAPSAQQDDEWTYEDPRERLHAIIVTVRGGRVASIFIGSIWD